MAAVVQAARLNGWRVYHAFDSRRSEPSFPDLLMLQSRELLVRELKVAGKLTLQQEGWLRAFSDGSVDASVWTPDDCPEIERTLR